MTITCNFFLHLLYYYYYYYYHYCYYYYYFWLKCVLKALWTCVESFGKTYRPVSDLQTSCQFEKTPAKVYKSYPNPNPWNAYKCPKTSKTLYVDLSLCSVLELLDYFYFYLFIYFFWLKCVLNLTLNLTVNRAMQHNVPKWRKM